MVYIGTSGFSYDDWIGHFYPEDIQRRDMLRYYAERFKCVELNFTYYRMPDPRTLGQMAAKTPDGFRFVVKANSEMTHERSGEAEPFRQFTSALKPLMDVGKFGCVLAQFPYSFRPTRETVAYLRFFREQTPDLPVVVEFRNSHWATDKAYQFLGDRGFGYCCVDEPDLRGLMPRVAIATADPGYVRFHGRNAEQWFDHEQAWQRYDYLYSEDELREWVPKVTRLADETATTYVFFNNHYQSKAAINASLFDQLMQDA